MLLLLFSIPHAMGQEHSSAGKVLRTQVKGAITPATVDLVADAVATAENGEYTALLIELDTPGGLVKSMREIVSTLLNTSVPVLVWVGPPGARAASAGVFIVAAADVAAMAPQTTMGAASPVGMGGQDVGKTMESKIKNDLKSYIRTLADTHGRNAAWYERAVEEAVSITSQEAVMDAVVDLIADTSRDLLDQLAARSERSDDRTVPGAEQAPPIHKDTTIVDHEPGLRHALLSWLLDPQIAYLLLLGGMAGLFFELSTPGVVLPGVFGGLSLLLGLYALSILPTSTAGILLMLFAVVLFVLEIYITSFGMLGLAGLTALFIGSLILIRPEPGFEGVPLGMVTVTVGTLALILGACLYLVTKAQRGASVHGLEALVGMTVRVTKWSNGRGTVLVRGETWQATADQDIAFAPGDEAVVSQAEGLLLTIDRANDARASVSGDEVANEGDEDPMSHG